MNERSRDLDARHNERARREVIAFHQRRSMEENLEQALALQRAATEVKRAFAGAGAGAGASVARPPQR